MSPEFAHAHPLLAEIVRAAAIQVENGDHVEFLPRTPRAGEGQEDCACADSARDCEERHPAPSEWPGGVKLCHALCVRHLRTWPSFNRTPSSSRSPADSHSSQAVLKALRTLSPKSGLILIGLGVEHFQPGTMRLWCTDAAKAAVSLPGFPSPT